jgi:hypothetical protein
MRLPTTFNKHNLLVINEPLCIAGTAGANGLFGLSDTPVYHVNKAAFLLTKREPPQALQLRNSYVVKNVTPKSTAVTVAQLSAPRPTRQLRSAAVRPSGPPSKSAGVAKRTQSVASVNVKSVRGAEPRKAPAVSVPQVAPPTSLAIGAPAREALVAVPAEPATLQMESSREASP